MNTNGTNYTDATIHKKVAMMGLVSALDRGFKAWIEIRNNKDCVYPYLKPNPNIGYQDYEGRWSYNTVYSHNVTDTIEKDLIENWAYTFAKKEARELYINEGIVTEGLDFGIGICTNVKISDLNKLREGRGETFIKAGHVQWTLKVKRNVVDDSIGNVFVVCTYSHKLDSEDEYFNLISEGVKFLTENNL